MKEMTAPLVQSMVDEAREDERLKGLEVMEKKTSAADFKAKAVLESLQGDTTLEAACQKCGVSRSQLMRWRQEFQEKVPGLFVDKRNAKEKTISQGYKPGESPGDCKKVSGELTMQNEIKKASLLLGTRKTVSTGGSGSPVVRTQWPLLEKPGCPCPGHRSCDALLAVQAVKDKQIAVAIGHWHEMDDTPGHRTLAGLLHMGKNLVRRLVHTYSIEARHKQRKYVYPGKSSQIVPNLVRQLDPESLTEVVFSDIFEVELADGTNVRGCFTLWKRTRHILRLAFEYYVRTELAMATLQTLSFEVPATIFHSDQGKQFGA
jgi:transposase-like protein